ncbi:hypothetical protein Vqi01_03030 [Micromonospora qiuiae]|uniref:Uncharacterized protein n=2 Tax=Micromonospora qiuiae TaxID=502268 RepID=A0ABQ4J4P5_9ACTN|nr:hypothetical protein Vqi01_03030 [Micromonospora qiuiae]
MSKVRRVDRARRRESMVNRVLAVCTAAVAALLVIALVGGEVAATAAAVGIGTTVTALVRVATTYLAGSRDATQGWVRAAPVDIVARHGERL